MKLSYPACFYQDEETGNYVVEIPDLPGCVTGGATLEEAIRMAKDAAEGWLIDELEDGRVLPEASQIEKVDPDIGGIDRRLYDIDIGKARLIEHDLVEIN